MTKTLVEELREDIGDGAVVLLVGGGHRYDPLRLKAADEIEQLRGNLSLAEDGLAAAVQEIEHRDRQLKESVDHEVEYQRQIELLTADRAQDQQRLFHLEGTVEQLRTENTALRNLAANLRPGPISEALAGATAEPSDGYKDAFYAIGELIGLTAMPISPKEVFETRMLPVLRELLSRAEKKSDEPPNVVGQFFRSLNDDAEARADIEAEGDPENRRPAAAQKSEESLRGPQGECPTGDYEQAGTDSASVGSGESPALSALKSGDSP